MNVDISPDGKTIVFDLLGNIYALPAGGGAARPLRQTQSWDTNPRYSHDGSEIWFVSDIDGGMRSLWAMPAAGGEARQIASFPDRDIVSFVTPTDRIGTIIERKGEGRLPPRDALWVKSADALTPVVGYEATDQATGVVAFPRSSDILFAQSEPFSGKSAYSTFNIFRFDTATGAKRMLVGDGFSPHLSPDGSILAFYRGEHANLWVRDLATGSERMLRPKMGLPRLYARTGWHIQSARGIMPSFAFDPSGRSIILSSEGKLKRIDIVSGTASPIPFVAPVKKYLAPPARPSATIGATFDARQLLSMSSDRGMERISFSAAGRIWLANLRTGAAREIAPGGITRDFLPSISPDGRSIAFVRLDTPHAELRLWRTGDILQNSPLLATAAFFSRPSWSPDGKRLAFVRMNRRSCADLSALPQLAIAECRMLAPRMFVGLQDIVELNIENGSERILRSAIIPSPESLPSFATGGSIAYSFDGRHLFLTEPSASNQRDLVITTLDLANGSQAVQVTIGGASGVRLAIPSPDGRRVAVATDDEMWVLDTEGVDSSQPMSLREPTRRMQRIGLAGYSAIWTDSASLVWPVGSHVFRWKQGTREGVQISRVRASVRNAAASGMLAFVNATIIPMDSDRVIEKGTILVDGSRIVAVGPTGEIDVPLNAEIIDVTGKTILPGFIDTHAHPRTSTCCRWGRPTDQHKPYLASLAWGVTTIFDPLASNSAVTFSKAEMIAAGGMVGPRVFSAGNAIFGNQANFESEALSREGSAAICGIVRQRALNGALMVKSYQIGQRQWRQRLVECALSESVGATTEGGGDLYGQLTHYMDGHSATEHNLIEPLIYDDIVQFIGRSGTFYTPVTPGLLGGQESARYFGTRGATPEDPRVRSFLPETYYSYVRVGGYIPEHLQAIYDVSRSARKIIRAGGKIALGSHGQFDGIGLHQDMWMLQLGGIEPFDLLRASTIWGAEKLGLSRDIGTIEPEKLADLVVLDCNPLGDIRCSSKVRYVLKSGVAYDAETLSLVGVRNGDNRARTNHLSFERQAE